MQYSILWGKNGSAEINQLKQKIAEQKVLNDLLKKQNESLKYEVQELITNPNALEDKAREQLGLIKPGETFYRIIPKEN